MNRKRTCIFSALTVVTIAWLSTGMAAGQDSVVLRGATIETMDQAGRIGNGQILIVDGAIREVGEKVSIPDNARIIDLDGKTVMPGLVDPYTVVNFRLGAEPEQEVRTVVFGGRTFTIPSTGGRRAPVSFVRIADVFDPRPGDWDLALRNGITSINIVTGGYGQSSIGNPLPKDMFDESFVVSKPGGGKDEAKDKPAGSEGGPAGEISPPSEPEPVVHPIVRTAAGLLYTTVTNDTTSLKTIRDGLRDPEASRPASGDQPDSSAPSGASSGRERGGRGGITPESRMSNSRRGGSPAASSTNDPSAKLWEAVRKGERLLLVNANNAAGMLYLLQEHDKAPKARLAMVGNGSDWFQMKDRLKGRKLTVVLPPRIDTHPFSRDRINVPRLLNDEGIEFVFSLTAGQSDYRSMQHNPLFPVSMLVKSGLPREKALQALTIGPAKLLGIDHEAGSIAVGKRADLIVFDADPLEATSGVEQVWIAGKKVYNASDE